MAHADSTLEYTVTSSENCRRPLSSKEKVALSSDRERGAIIRARYIERDQKEFLVNNGRTLYTPQTNPWRKPIITPAYERIICRNPKVATASDVDPVGETGLVDVEAVDPVVAAGKVVVVV